MTHQQEKQFALLIAEYKQGKLTQKEVLIVYNHFTQKTLSLAASKKLEEQAQTILKKAKALK